MAETRELERVLGRIAANEEAYLAELAEYVKIPSIGSNAQAMMTAARYVTGILHRHGLQPSMIDPGGGAFPIIVAEKPGRAPATVIFYNHYDIADYTNPLELEGPEIPVSISTDRITGRGVADDKGCTLSRIHAVSAWLAEAGDLPVGVRFVIVGKRTAGDADIHRCIYERPDLKNGDLVLWETGAKTADDRPTLSLGAKGYLYVELTARGARGDTPSRFTIFPNPAWRLVEALGTLRRGEEIAIAGFYDDVMPTTKGDRAFLSQADNSEFEQVRVREGFSHFIDHKEGLALMEQLYVTPTLTLCGLNAGFTGEGEKLVLPGQATAKLEFRLVPAQDPDKVLDQLRAHLNARGYGDLELNVLGKGRAFRTPPEDPMVGAVLTAAAQVYPQPPVVRITSIGMSAKWAFAPVPNVGVGVEYWGSRLETPQEHLRRRDYTEGCQFIAAILDEAARAPEH